MTDALPPKALARLGRAEKRQRRETASRGLPAFPVSIMGLWLLQFGKCGCGCDAPLNPLAEWNEKSPPDDYIVIAHVLARGSRGTHDRKNVELWRHACNARDARPDTSGAASVKRFAPDYSKREQKEEKPKRKIQGRSLPGKGAVKMQSRGFDKTLRKKMDGTVERVER